jgi:hypothetical protein
MAFTDFEDAFIGLGTIEKKPLNHSNWSLLKGKCALKTDIVRK